MSSSTNVGTSDKVDLPIDYDTENLVGHWGETLNDFSEDGENIVPITEVDDVRLLDVDDVEIVRTIATAGNGVDVEDDVWDAVVARLGLVNDKSVWGYVEPEPNQLEHIYPAYEPPAHMYEDRMVTLQADATSMRVRTFDPNGAEFTVEEKVRGACSKQYSVQMSLLRCADMRSHQLLDIYELVVPKDY
ncbi:hypothetical protein V6N12_064941 [Hibiscus sabdariffa]|uniref:Uncharacterized protein n=1 Tax=Hibiscus sabdariffa TaxID=183260 RepID=A0ABR2G7L5_9ROSI